MKIAIVLGTRPEIIKMAPIIRELIKKNQNFFIIHTNQHYSKEMDAFIFKDLSLPTPRYNLEVGSGKHGKQTGMMLTKIEEVYTEEKPDIVLVHGDTNSTLSGALAATKLHIKVGHVEAGLRSFDRKMPEEINRIIIDHISDYLFVPTIQAEQHLLDEGISKEKIDIVGNTVVDTVLQNKELASRKSTILDTLDIKETPYCVLTCHRPSNVDDEESFTELVHGLIDAAKAYDYTVVFPVHPRTANRMKEYGIVFPERFMLIESLGYLDMLQLLMHAKILYTDSGGLQEEAYILQIPTLTLRENTERPESLVGGGNILVGNSATKIIEGTHAIHKKSIEWQSNIFGKGDTSEKIVSLITKE